MSEAMLYINIIYTRRQAITPVRGPLKTSIRMVALSTSYRTGQSDERSVDARNAY